MRDPRERMSWAGIPDTVLDIPLSLNSGQVFRWERGEDGTWLGVVGSTAVQIRPEPNGFWWITDPPGQWDVLQSFFNLGVNLEGLYREWIAADADLSRVIDRYRGLRVLRQPPESALCSFVCSSCNNVPRIAGMVRSLARLVCRSVGVVGGYRLYADPMLEDLAGVREDQLREAGFGYRARYLALLGALAASRQAPALHDLARQDWPSARSALMALPGVGPKVADCVGLFGMGRHDVVPVDTHIHRYLVARYRPDLAGRSLTARVYGALAAEFRGIMGAYAGWAQQYLFMAARECVLTTGLQGGNA